MELKRNRVIFYVSTVAFWFSMYTYVPVLAPYVEHTGGSLFFVGLVLGSYGLTQMLLRVPLGIWSDRIGKRKVFILLGMLCATLSSLGFTFDSSPLSALIFRALAGVAASSWVLFTVLFSSYFPREEAAKAMGLISFFNSIGQMLATASGGYFAEHYGWHAPFFLGAAVGGIGLFAAFFIQEEKMSEQRQPVAVGDLFRVGKQWSLLSISLIAVLAQSIVFTTMFGFTPLHAASLGASKGELGILALLTTLPNAIAGYISGSIVVRKIGEKQTVMLGFVLSAVCTISIPFTTSFGMLLFSQACNGFGQGLIFPVLLALAIRNVSPEQRATAMGFFQAIFSLGMFGGPLLAGGIGDVFGLTGGFLFTGVLSLVGAVLASRWIASPALYQEPAKKRAT
ncbi:MFS transporter [Ectobacillus funiculus]|uniref:MFS transporter n=1 Tax=Ectobacillus funiculus TaxID=137993 RepID=A0ABV5WN78_9BACI